MTEDKDRDDADFDAMYERACNRYSAQYGFAVRSEPGTVLTAERRRKLVASRGAAALNYLVELQQSLVDDDESVRLEARQGVTRVMYRAYTGDHSETAWKAATKQSRIDSTLGRVLGGRDPDGPEPWWCAATSKRLIRTFAIAGALLCALLTAFLITINEPALAIVSLSAAAVLDVFDGAFARISKMRSAELRWMSCLASHLGDLIMIGAVAFALGAGGSASVAAAVISAMFLSAFGSFSRVSALQAGYRFWRSRLERIFRYGAIAAYCLLAIAGFAGLGAYVLAACVGIFGIWEIFRVTRSVLSMPDVKGGGIMFVDTSDTVRVWGLEDAPSTNWPSVSVGSDGGLARP